jgi:flagellin
VVGAVADDVDTDPTFAFSNIETSRGTHAPVGGSDITTSALANTALGVLDTAITNVNSTRAGLGASMSRLEYASDNLQNVAQNTASARSRVMDADYAAETTELARTQIIQQASTAMLAQANQSQQAVLALLR